MKNYKGIPKEKMVSAWQRLEYADSKYHNKEVAWFRSILFADIKRAKICFTCGGENFLRDIQCPACQQKAFRANQERERKEYRENCQVWGLRQ